jgi:hypothetical protein
MAPGIRDRLYFNILWGHLSIPNHQLFINLQKHSKVVAIVAGSEPDLAREFCSGGNAVTYEF